MTIHFALNWKLNTLVQWQVSNFDETTVGNANWIEIRP